MINGVPSSVVEYSLNDKECQMELFYNKIGEFPMMSLPQLGYLGELVHILALQIQEGRQLRTEH